MDLPLKEQLDLYQQLHEKFSEPNFVVCVTGYTSCLTGGNYLDLLLEICADYDVLPSFIVDYARGKGIYIFDEYKNNFFLISNTEQIPDHLKQIVNHCSQMDGVIVFEADTNLNWTSFLTKLKYRYNFDQTYGKIEMIGDKIVKTIYYDSESGWSL